MHLLLIHQAFNAPQECGGTRHYEMAQHLIQAGHRVTIICSDTSYLTGRSSSMLAASRDVQGGGLEICRVRSTTTHHHSYLSRLTGFVSFSSSALTSAVAEIQPDVVLGTTPPPLQPFAAYLASRVHRVPFVLEVRDLFWDYALQSQPAHLHPPFKLARFAERWLCRRADHIIVNSPGFIPHLMANGVPENDITLIPNSVDVTQFRPSAADRTVWASFGCTDSFIVLYAGAHGMLNDLDTLLRAAVAVRDCPEIRICLMGDGKEKAALMRRAVELQATNVIFIPAQPKSAAPAFIGSADVCVALLKDMPILRTVYPNKVFDYMAAARPVIVAIDGSIREVVESARAGAFVQPGNHLGMAEAIRTMYRNRASLRELGQNARDYVTRHFNRADQARKLEQILVHLIARKDMKAS